MAYSDSIKLRAYTLFLQGESYDRIADVLFLEFGKKIAAGTVRNWAEKDDGQGNWITNRARIRSIARQNADEVATSRTTQIRIKSETIQNALYDKLLSESGPEISSFEGAVYAFKTISEFTLKLEREDKGVLSPLFVVQAMLDLFRDIPDVRRMIDKHWDRIKEEIDLRLKRHEHEIIEVKEIVCDTQDR